MDAQDFKQNTTRVMKVKPGPDQTEGRGSEMKPPVESITRLFFFYTKEKLEGTKKTGRSRWFFSEMISSCLDEKKCARQLSHPPTAEIGVVVVVVGGFLAKRLTC